MAVPNLIQQAVRHGNTKGDDVTATPGGSEVITQPSPTAVQLSNASALLEGEQVSKVTKSVRSQPSLPSSPP